MWVWTWLWCQLTSSPVTLFHLPTCSQAWCETPGLLTVICKDLCLLWLKKKKYNLKWVLNGEGESEGCWSRQEETRTAETRPPARALWPRWCVHGPHPCSVCNKPTCLTLKRRQCTGQPWGCRAGGRYQSVEYGVTVPFWEDTGKLNSSSMSLTLLANLACCVSMKIGLGTAMLLWGKTIGTLTSKTSHSKKKSPKPHVVAPSCGRPRQEV